jgi:hypothetical protein
VTAQGDFAAGTLRLVGEVTIEGMVNMHSSFGGELLELGERSKTLPLTVHAGSFDFSGRGSKVIQRADLFSGPITFGPDVVLSGRNVQATFANPLLNQGQITADLVPDFAGDTANTFTFTTAPVTNEGLLEAKNGGLLTINNLVTNRGTIAARTGSVVSIGGDLPLEAGGTVTVEIAGRTTSEVGRITSAGAATLAGTLNIQLANGFVPAVGDRFEVIQYASHTGTFTTVLGANLPNGLVLVPEYGVAGLTLVVQ